MFLGGVPAGDVVDVESIGGVCPHRISLRLRCHVPVPRGARGPGRPRPPAWRCIGRRSRVSEPRREPQRPGEQRSSDPRGCA